jgi:ABC-type phosphate transport system substrate-binding protein
MNLKTLLTTASALGAMLFAGHAQAATPTPTLVYGGGASSAAKIFRDVFNCYVALADGIYATTPGNASTAVYPPGPSSACKKQGKVANVIAYESINSPAGLSAFTEASPVPLGTPSTTNTIAYLDSTFGISATPYPEIQFAGTDIYLNSTQASQAETASGEPIFQIPVFVTPYALGVGGTQNVKLTTADVCNIFSGSTNVSKAGVTFSELVVRSDASGSTFVISDFLAQNCSASLGFNSANGFPGATPSWSAVIAQNGGRISLVSGKGSSGEAAAIAATTNAIGYVSVDYTSAVVSGSTVYPAYLNALQPTLANVKTRLLKETYPTSYNATTIGQQLNDQLVAPGGKGYQLVSFTFIDAYQCYSASYAAGLIGGPAQGAALLAVLKTFYTGSDTAILNASGYLQAPTTVYNLVKGTGGPLNSVGGLQNSACPST